MLLEEVLLLHRFETGAAPGETTYRRLRRSLSKRAAQVQPLNASTRWLHSGITKICKTTAYCRFWRIERADCSQPTQTISVWPLSACFTTKAVTIYLPTGPAS